MRKPKGFGKNYFSLTAIQATVTAVTIHSLTVATQILSFQHLSLEDTEDDPNTVLLDILTPSTITSEPDQRPIPRSCHCNCHFKHKTRNIFLSLYSKFKPKYLCRNLLTGIAPPSLNLFSS